MNRENIVVVLVEPQGSLNIGSVARAMANFGFIELRLVNPQTGHLNDEARRMAVKAANILEQASVYDSLRAALADCQIALGTTRRFGKYREDFLHPDEIGAMAAPSTSEGNVALVFGREDKGLLTEELDLCQRFITIPTSDKLPSMNLAQSVSICLYELSKYDFDGDVRHGRQKLASGQTLESLYDHMRQTLQDIEYLDSQNPDHILHTYRRIFGRALLNDREVRILRGLFSRIDWVENDRRQTRGSTKMSESVLSTQKLENGLEIAFHDSGNRYFGNFHQVKIIVVCRIPLSEDLLCEHLSADDLKKALQLFGDHIEYKKLLKQMGVAGEDVEGVKQALIDNFMQSASDYMQGEDFASRFVARRLVEHRNRNRLHLVGYD